MLMNEILSSSMFLEVFVKVNIQYFRFYQKLNRLCISHEILSKVPEIPKLWPEYA